MKTKKLILVIFLTFINWKTAEASDYEWIRMEKTLTTADKDKIAAVIK